MALAEAESLTGLEIPIANKILEIHSGHLKLEKTQEYLKVTANLLRPDVNTQTPTS